MVGAGDVGEDVGSAGAAGLVGNDVKDTTGVCSLVGLGWLGALVDTEGVLQAARAAIRHTTGKRLWQRRIGLQSGKFRRLDLEDGRSRGAGGTLHRGMYGAGVRARTVRL